MSSTPSTVDESEAVDDDVASVEAHFGDASSCSSVSVQNIADLEQCEDIEDVCDEKCESVNNVVSSQCVIDDVEDDSSVTAAGCAVPVSVDWLTSMQLQDAQSNCEQSADASNSSVLTGLGQSGCTVILHNQENMTVRHESAQRTALWCAVTSVTAADKHERVTVNHCDEKRLLSVSEEDRSTDTHNCHTAMSHGSHLPAGNGSCGEVLVANSCSNEPCQSSDSCAVNLPLVEDGLSSGHVSDADDVNNPAAAADTKTSSTQRCQLMCDTSALCDEDDEDDDDDDEDDDEAHAQTCCDAHYQQPVCIARYNVCLWSSTDRC